jgi:hypothetical protein
MNNLKLNITVDGITAGALEVARVARAITATKERLEISECAIIRTKSRLAAHLTRFRAARRQQLRRLRVQQKELRRQMDRLKPQGKHLNAEMSFGKREKNLTGGNGGNGVSAASAASCSKKRSQ